MIINNFSDFCSALTGCGFSMGGGNPKGIFALIPYSWENQEFIDSPVKWHTGNTETDPWEWRMRVLEERDDFAYSKVFFRTSGYITKEWYPHFYAVRRMSESFEDAYENGTVSITAKRICDIISRNGETSFHEIKKLGGFGKEDNSRFDKAIIDLQTRMFITMCGRAQKVNKFGELYGWNSTVFTTVEDFWHKRAVSLPLLDPEESYNKIRDRIILLNPAANAKTIDRFIKG